MLAGRFALRGLARGGRVDRCATQLECEIAQDEHVDVLCQTIAASRAQTRDDSEVAALVSHEPPGYRFGIALTTGCYAGRVRLSRST